MTAYLESRYTNKFLYYTINLLHYANKFSDINLFAIVKHGPKLLVSISLYYYVPTTIFLQTSDSRKSLGSSQRGF